ncbi:MAG: hypothetical protein EXR11_08715 [Rhodospirillaceae bacterium]|nr:hypothetical protein [Rhodospirillaceae bacterium]
MSKHVLYWTTSALALAAAIMAEAPTAAAQNVAKFTLEEIVVTARRREENLMEVPMAVTAITAERIDAAGIKTLDQLSIFTPGLTVDVSANSRLLRILTFRGLSASSGQVFVDGVALAGNGTPYLGALDRIEVLVGPQSVYFGRATFQGALNFVTRAPSEAFQGKVQAEYGSFNVSDFAVTVEGPIVPGKVATSLSVRKYYDGGQYRNYSNPSEKMGQFSNLSYISSTYFTPNDSLTAKLFLDREVEDFGPTAAVALKGNSLPRFGGTGTQIPGVTGGSQELFCDTQGTFGTYYCGAIPEGDEIDPRIISGNFNLTPYLQSIFFGNIIRVPLHFDPNFMTHAGGKSVADMAHLNLDYDFDNSWSFASIAAYHRTKTQSIQTTNYRDTRDVPNPTANQPIPAGQLCCRLPYLSFYLMNQNLFEDINVEARVTSPPDLRLRGTLGASYLRQILHGNFNFGQTKTTPQHVGTASSQEVKTPAVFGGAYYDITPEFHLGVEARYQSDKVTATPFFPINLAAPGRSDTYKSFSPRVTLDYNYAPDSMVFTLFSRGYRRGGFNPGLVGQPQSVLAQLAATGAGLTFAQEKLDNFELGWKSTWMEGRARTTLIGYFQPWRNGQVSDSINFVDPTGSVQRIVVTTNGGVVNLFGLELEAEIAVTENLTVNATANYQGSEIKSYNYLIGNQIHRSIDVVGNSFWGFPVFKSTVSPTYTAPLAGDWDWYARADWKFKGRYNIDATNIAWVGSHSVFDLRLGAKRDDLTIEAYVTNILDDRHFSFAEYGADSSGSTGASIENEIRLAMPRMRAFGLKVSYTF